MKNHELLCRLALTQLPGIGIVGAHKLLDATEGKAAMLSDHPKDLGDIIPGISPKIASVLDAPEVLRRCEAELSFAEKNHIACLLVMMKLTPPGSGNVMMLHLSCFTGEQVI